MFSCRGKSSTDSNPERIDWMMYGKNLNSKYLLVQVDLIFCALSIVNKESAKYLDFEEPKFLILKY